LENDPANPPNRINSFYDYHWKSFEGPIDIPCGSN